MMCQFLKVKTKLGTKYFVQSSSIAAAVASAALLLLKLLARLLIAFTPFREALE